MNQNLWFALANNSALLLILFIAYEVSYLIKKRIWLRQIVSGLLTAAICIIIMGTPFQLYPGIVFDTRSILISVASMFFGPVTALITAVAAILFRLSAGGAGTAAGIAVITISMMIGLAWRRWFYPKSQRLRVLNLFIMSVIVHAAMLACMLLIPYPDNLNVISSIALPVMLIYPVASVLLCALLMIQQDRKRNQEQLRQSEERFQLLFNKAPLGYQSLDSDGRFIAVNQQWLDTFGYEREDIIGKWFGSFIEPSYLSIFDEHFKVFIKQGSIHCELEMLDKKGDPKFISFEGKVAYDPDGKFKQTHCILKDITEQRKIEQALRESERSKTVLLSHIPGIAYRCAYDREWTMRYISDGCYTLTGYKAEELINNNIMSYNDLICEEYREGLWSEWARIINEKSTFRSEYEITTASGERKWVLEMGQPIFDEHGNIQALEGIVIDISESKQRFNQIQYMNDHDFMTGLFNRKYFEEKKKLLDIEENLPLSIVFVDINGVRLINDAFGHSAGDEIIIKTGEIISRCCRDNALLARTGGDEFGILVPNTDSSEADDMLLSIMKACDEYNSTIDDKAGIINLSMGYGVKHTMEQNISEIENEAEENMYKRKLLGQESHHSAIISSVMATMYARSQETEEHAKRLAELSRKIGTQMNLPQKSLDELELLSMLHDIGKIGIDDRILNKPGKLNKDEWSLMKKHPEIGYRIAKSSQELKPVAEYILCHHERWDGDGYPNCLKGEKIPLLSRILAVVDAYDAMTEDRVYRKALEKEEAIKEIERNAGKQFDPKIAQLFVQLITAS